MREGSGGGVGGSSEEKTSMRSGLRVERLVSLPGQSQRGQAGLRHQQSEPKDVFSTALSQVRCLSLASTVSFRA